MALSEFRYNKKRKHYAYIFKDCGDYRKNLLLHSEKGLKKCHTEKERQIFYKKHIKLYRHPNSNKDVNSRYFVEKRIYTDHKSAFDDRNYSWKWDPNDKRIIKRLKKGRRTR